MKRKLVYVFDEIISHSLVSVGISWTLFSNLGGYNYCSRYIQFGLLMIIERAFERFDMKRIKVEPAIRKLLENY